MEIELGRTTVELLPGRAVFLKGSRSLVVADIHLGKSATFRNRGLPVPEGTTESDLRRLSQLVETNLPSQLIIAGDLVHSADGLSEPILSSLGDFLADLPIPVILTEGNHDARAWISGRKLPFHIVADLLVDGITITHDPSDLAPNQPGIAGHLHPGARIAESRRRAIRVPGFFLQASQHLILPAFSEFTGIHPMTCRKNDRFFAEMSGKISEIPRQLIR